MLLKAVSIILLGFMIIPVFADATWFNTDWEFFKQITIDHKQVRGNLTDFPFLVNIIDVNLTANAQADCDDILFTTIKNIKLSHEIENCDLTNNDSLVAWVKIPTISFIKDTKFNMYYGNPTATNQQDIFNVWDNNFILVDHLNGTSEIDSTDGRNNGTNTGATSIDEGYVGGGKFFDGINDFVRYNNKEDFDFTVTDTFTWSAWINATNTASTQWIGGKGISSGGIVDGWHQYIHFSDSQNYIKFTNDDGITLQQAYPSNDPKITDQEWYYVFGKYHGTETEGGMEVGLIVPDGNMTGTKRSTSASVVDGLLSVENVTLATSNTQNADFTGQMDEFRISDKIRDWDWLYYEWCNMVSNDDCHTIEVGLQQTKRNINAIFLTLNPPTETRLGGALQSQLSYTVYKHEDETRTLDTFNRPDNDLHFTMEENSIYYIEMRLFWQATSANDLNIDFELPEGAIGYMLGNYYRYIAMPTTAADLSTNIASNGAVQTLARYVIIYTTDTGEYELTWSQQSSGATDSTLLKGSVMSYHRLGCNIC